MVRRLILTIYIAVFCSTALNPSPTAAQTAHLPAKPAILVEHYKANITPSFQNRTVSGQVEIHFRVHDNSATQLTLDADNLAIETVWLLNPNGNEANQPKSNQPLLFKVENKQLIIEIGTSLKKNTNHIVVIQYQAKEASGVQFLPNTKSKPDSTSLALQVFTAFSTSQWLPCRDAPNERATFDLTLAAPASLQVLAPGKKVFSATDNGSITTTRWVLDQPMPSYLYGFAVGEFREVLDQQPGQANLRFLAPTTFDDNQIRQIFKETRSIMAFYEAKTGVKYPFETYTQLLVRGNAAQEMSTYSIMGEGYGRRVLKDEKNIWLGVHELSHQWWGNGLTNQSWREMWLNEGIATFMTSAYLEHRFGREAYLQEVNAGRLSYEKIRDAGADKALIFPSWDAPTAQDRSLVYDKGSYVVHLLREQLGEDHFWAGLRHFTQTNWGKSVSTVSFQKAMEYASGQNLNAFFDRWIYQAPVRP
jgi:aminopeptidase N